MPLSPKPKRSTSLSGITDLAVLARIRPGMIPGSFESESLRERLQRVLATLNAVRKLSREAAPMDSPIPDSIGRFRGIHFFRFSVIPDPSGTAVKPAEVGQTDTADRLLVNVTFDGGWEPYMRLIWGPLGTLLDLIYCHCEHYPHAFKSSYDEYIGWVREYEVPGQFFYADSAGSVADRAYLTELEALQRADGGKPGADLRTHGLALPLQPQVVQPSAYAVESSLRVLAALWPLMPLFPKSTASPKNAHDGDNGILLRFAQDLLADLRNWIKDGHLDPNGSFGHVRVRPGVSEQLNWLMSPRHILKPQPPRLQVQTNKLQAGIVNGYPAAVRFGVLGLFRVADAAKVRTWLATVPFTREGTTPVDGIYRNLALTYSGLKVLGVPEWRTNRLPQEFIDGMEQRAGILGDVRGNHPTAWRRPRRANGQQVELGAVHVLVQMRTTDVPDPRPTSDDGTYGPLGAALDALQDQGLTLLARQPMQRPLVPADQSQARDHFGFADGIGQPTLNPPAVPASQWSDTVKPGEILIGHPNARDKIMPPLPDDDGSADHLLDDGSFIVIRKLRQFPERLDAVAQAAANLARPGAPALAQDLAQALKALMVGRRQDGGALAAPLGIGGANDFDYRNDAAGLRCPHASHVRRANPRGSLPDAPLPRLMRRGMPYVNTANPTEKGLMFMAYGANLAEQFEVVQRWLAGGNASGVSSMQDDPLLGVPDPGRQRIFRCVVGNEVLRVDLGPAPLVSLQWGLYALAPSASALQKLGDIVADTTRPSARDPAAPVPPRTPPPDSGLNQEGLRWLERLEDRNTRDRTWAAVRALPAPLATNYGVLVGDAPNLLQVLRDDGQQFSAGGYGGRMGSSIGVGYLGQDDAGTFSGHAVFAREVNLSIDSFLSEEQAFDQAHALAASALTGLQAQHTTQTAVDFRYLAGRVIADLCTAWFGLPDAAGAFMARGAVAGGQPGATAKAHCPDHYFAVSRYIFSTPHPSALVTTQGQKQGAEIRAAVQKWLKAGGLEDSNTRAPLAKDIIRALINKVPKATPDDKADLLAGIMLGFPPTVMGNLVGVLSKWAGSGMLWELQAALPTQVSAAAGLQLLRAPLLRTMATAPVPNVIWRTAAKDGTLGRCPVAKDQKIILGLGAAVAADAVGASPGVGKLMFGLAPSGQPTIHGCPGYKLAVGVMAGTMAALLSVGTLRPGGSPLQVLWVHGQKA